MTRELVGFGAVAVLALTAISHWRSIPDKGNYTPSTNAFPRFHLYKGRDDVDASVDVRDSADHAVGRLVLDDGRLYSPKDQSIHATYTSDLYLVEPGWDLGTCAGYRDGGQARDDRFSVGLRLSPCRLLYGTTAPDLVLAKDWAGAGLSFYLPSELVGQQASHIGIGAWYGVPFSSADNSGSAAWCYGLSFSTH